jgi:uncharacterized membrane protein YbhN (UPF0104 family)
MHEADGKLCLAYLSTGLTIGRGELEYTRVFKNRVVYILLSAAISAVLLWLLFSRVKTEDVVQTVSRIYIPAVFAYIAVALLGAWLRSWRYKLLLRPRTISWGNILMVTFIRNSLIDLFPARLGSLSYIYVLNKRLGFSFEAATSSFVLAFFLDFLTLSPFLVAAVVIVGLGATVISTPALLAVSLAFFLLIFFVLWRIVPLSRLVLATYRRLLRLWKGEERKFARVSVEKFGLTIDSLSEIVERKIYAPVVALSFLIRLAKYVSVYALFYSLLRSRGFSLEELSFWKFILGISGAELTSALPVKGLAGFGTWESAWALTFRLMNFDPALAIISGIGVHLLSNIFEYSLGVASILVLAWPYLKKTRHKHDRL